MSNRDLVRLVLSNLNRMRARVALTTIGVLIGTIAIILLISLAIGLQRSLETDLLASFGDLTTIQVFGGGNPFGGAPPDEPVEPLNRARIRDLAAIDHVIAVTPQVGLAGAAQLKLGRLEAFGNIQGVDPAAAEAMGWELASGRVRLGRGQILIGTKVFENAVTIGRPGRAQGRVSGGGPAEGPPDAGGETPILQDRSITLELTRVDEQGNDVTRNERLRVVGVFEESDGERDWSVMLALDDVEAYNAWLQGDRIERDPEYSQVVVKVDDQANVEAVQTEIEAMGYSFFSAGVVLEGIRQFFAIAQIVLGGVGGVAVVVAAIGIMNTMTMAIYERTREIGIMKAVGATNRDVLRIFLAEAGSIGCLGGITGALIGWAIGLGADFVVRTQLSASGNLAPDSTFRLVVTPLWLIAFAVGFSVLVGLVSGVFPALRAASMKPLRALRTE